LVLFTLLALVFPLVLYVFVQSEREHQQTMDRASAERTVRRDASQRDQSDGREDEVSDRFNRDRNDSDRFDQDADESNRFDRDDWS
jgi:hypothetical protein